MHIITGMLLTAVMRQRRKSGAKGAVAGPVPIQLPGVITVRHHLPGRIRFHVPLLAGQPEAATRLRETLAGIDAVDAATVDAVTGSVLVAYDADRLDPGVLGAALVRLLGLEKAAAREPDPLLARELRTFSKALNRAVYAQTDGLLDLHSILLLALAVIGLRKTMQQGLLALPAGFTLLWWSMHGLLRRGQDA